MNGTIILNNARQHLADEIFAYREPKPAPLKISPWLAMSLLQKAIPRGEGQLAQHAAATLLLIAPDRLWRRCGAAAFEEIGVADLDTVSLVTAALAGKRYRATIGGEWKVASFIVDRMATAPKCRSADDLLLTADNHPLFSKARADLATKTTAELIGAARSHVDRSRFCRHRYWFHQQGRIGWVLVNRSQEFYAKWSVRRPGLGIGVLELRRAFSQEYAEPFHIGEGRCQLGTDPQRLQLQNGRFERRHRDRAREP